MGGRTEASLAPVLRNCGGRGKRKNFRRFGLHRITNGKKTYHLTDADRDNIESSFKTIKDHATLKNAYIVFLNEYYPGSNDHPSYKQFYTELCNVRARLTKPPTDISERDLIGSARDNINGPGVRYLIDGTIDNVYIQSEDIPGAVVGRLTLYFIIDCYTGLICGFYFTNEHASYIVSCKALLNAATNKVDFCNLFGIDITENQWPCEHIPVILYADRGELVSNAASRIATNLKIKLTNAPAYRPELKGYVEVQFKVFQDRLVEYLSRKGLVDRESDPRMVENPVKQARFVMSDLVKLLINEIVAYNTSHHMWDHPDINEMLADNVDPTPSEIWLWACRKGKGNPRKRNTPELWRNLLTSEWYPCSFRQGIKIKDDYFIPIDSSARDLFRKIEASKSKAEVCSVSYSKVHKYLIFEGQFYPLKNRTGAESSNDFEHTFTKDYISERKNAVKLKILQIEREKQLRQNEICENAAARNPTVTSVKDIKKNRSEEIDRRRAKELESLDPDFPVVHDIQTPPDDVQSPPKSLTPLLKKMERLQNLGLH